MAVSDETKDCLAQVKKGKPRKFVLLTKGTNVVNLVVFKKGGFSKYVKEAKEEGKGIASYGVAVGRGVDITFKLSREDGFERSPTKTAVLKKFLEEEAEFTCKPLIEIVDSLDVVLDDDDPLVAEFRKLQASALKACDSHPERADEINSLCLEIGKLLDGEAPETAKAPIGQLAQLLKGLGSKAPAEPTESPTAPTTAAKVGPTPPEAAKAKLVEAFKQVKALVEKAINAQPDRRGELVASLTQIGGAIKDGKLKEAQSDLTTLVKQVQGLLAPKSPTQGTEAQPTQPNVEQRRYEELRDRLEPDYLQALKAVPDKRNALEKLWFYAEGQAEKENFANAVKALEGLEKAVADALANAPQSDAERFGIQKGLVAERVAALESYFRKSFEAAQNAADVQVSQLESAVAERVPSVDATDLTDGIQDYLQGLLVTVRDELITSLASQDKKTIEQSLAKCRRSVSADPLVVHLADSKAKLGVDTGVLDQFSRLFDSLASAVKA